MKYKILTLLGVARIDRDTYAKLINEILPIKPAMFSVKCNDQHTGNLFVKKDDAERCMEKLDRQFPCDFRSIVELYE